ncbi:NRPS-like protein [Dothistroma septosporum NZE10]|uniref:NRPS-like protein n=1 Tax=Dothistroma septosporum (strain NZE10 / CBS 128990) TaxID=675120 RepID=N1PNZ3_DOTSN|nr:NRPS-like protein [Dothistroma septosporum NZE10]
MDQHKDTSANMATATTTMAPPGAAQPSSSESKHHDASYLPTSRFNTIDGLLKSHAAEPEQTPLICYPKEGAADFELHTGQDLDRFTDAAVQFYLANDLEPADPTAERAPVVALLAPTTFAFVVSVFALNRLGWTALFLSTRLTASAHAKLLAKADCYRLIVPASRKSVVDEICNYRPGCSSVPVLQNKDFRNVPRAPQFRRENFDPVKEAKKLAWILHSSGSTGFPKPIFISNTACLANFRKSFGLRAFCVSPLFHSHGLMELGRAFYTRAPMYLGNHSLPVTAQNLIDALAVARPQQISAVPYVIQLLAEKEEGVRALAAAKVVLFSGSSCPDALGDRLVANGVNLVASYGSTEIGQIMTSFRPPGDAEWQYTRLLRPASEFTLMDEVAPGVFECVGLDGLQSKGTTNSNPPYSATNPVNSFRTADLFTRHPDPNKSNYYKYLSRLDDRITLVNGEKVLPLPIEGRIRQDDYVREAVIFGFQRTVPGVLIFRSNEKGLDLSDEGFLKAVWPSVEAANLQAESFARVPKEMIVIKSANLTYPRTDKGTFIRAKVYQQFSDEINKAYESFESGNSEQSRTIQLDVSDLEQWLLSKFSEELDIQLPNADADIFSAGVDSLQTTRMWRTIKRELDLGSGGQQLSQNIVFERGTIRQLARHLYNLRTGEVVQSDAEDEIAIMQEMIERYSSFNKHFPAQKTQPEKQVVLVTGATGNLGAFVVAELAKRDDVAEIWALVRAPGPAAAGARLMESLASRSINIPDAASSKIHAVPSDLSQTNLGLQTYDLEYLLSGLTSVIHSAWAVNFNLGVRSFEAQHIRGTCNLINLCLRGRLPKPASFYFCSSVSAASGTPKPATISELAVEDLRHAQRTGYGRSKLVTEHITRNAMRNTGMRSRVLRIGQLSGDTGSADWNQTEAIALMVRSALTTGCLPELDECPSWLPVDLCARAIVELVLPSSASDELRAVSQADPELVYHLVNPQTFNFKTGLLPALTRSKLPAFETVSATEWLERLEKSDSDVAKNPSRKLLDFWKGKYGNATQSTSQGDYEPSGLTFETTRTVHDAQSLRAVGNPVDEGLIERYIEVWLKKWQSL